MGLADYKGVLGTAASISSFVLLLSPSVLCLKIWKNKSSNNIPFPPLMEAMARSILMFQQGLVMGVWPIMITHTIGLLLNTTYITIYLTFTKDKTEAWRCMLRWATMLVPITAYAFYEDKTLLEVRFGSLVTTVTMSLMLYHLYAVVYRRFPTMLIDIAARLPFILTDQSVWDQHGLSAHCGTSRQIGFMPINLVGM
uniref:Uncharacterized protein n=1 Tax=Graphocephala atropunctata TaxID=36148 RepID=A0A1B6LNB9_9HEMI